MNRGEARPRDAKVIVRDFVIQDLDENQNVQTRRNKTRSLGEASIRHDWHEEKRMNWDSY